MQRTVTALSNAEVANPSRLALNEENTPPAFFTALLRLILQWFYHIERQIYGAIG